MGPRRQHGLLVHPRHAALRDHVRAGRDRWQARRRLHVSHKRGDRHVVRRRVHGNPGAAQRRPRLRGAGGVQPGAVMDRVHRRSRLRNGRAVEPDQRDHPRARSPNRRAGPADYRVGHGGADHRDRARHEFPLLHRPPRAVPRLPVPLHQPARHDLGLRHARRPVVVDGGDRGVGGASGRDPGVDRRPGRGAV